MSETRSKITEEEKKSIEVYLMLKGKWSTLTEESISLSEVFNLSYFLAYAIVYDLNEGSKITCMTFQSAIDQMEKARMEYERILLWGKTKSDLEIAKINSSIYDSR